MQSISMISARYLLESIVTSIPLTEEISYNYSACESLWYLPVNEGSSRNHFYIPIFLYFYTIKGL
jgi:hypothetical protein